MHIHLTAFPRLHLGLFDLGSATRRVFGGVGISISDPRIEISARPSSTVRFTTDVEMQEADIASIKAALARLSAMDPRFKAQVHLHTAPASHSGLGTKTAIILGVLKATTLACAVDISNLVLQQISQRGGASGVGVHAFFHGGVICDAGRMRSTEVPLLPSSAQNPSAPPPLVCHAVFPDEWTVLLLQPNGSSVSGAREIRFFQENTPVPNLEVLSTITEVYHGVIPAILEKRLDVLADSLRTISGLGFKRREIAAQPRSAELLKLLQRMNGCAAGMSSLGPLVYCILHKDDEDTLARITRLAGASEIATIGSVKGKNSGYEVCS